MRFKRELYPLDSFWLHEAVILNKCSGLKGEEQCLKLPHCKRYEPRSMLWREAPEYRKSELLLGFRN